MRDLALDKDTHDLLFSSNDLEVVIERERVEQSLKQRILFYAGEWFLDTGAGIPYYDRVLTKNPNIPDVETVFKAEILDTPEVRELTEFKSNFDKSARTFGVEFTVITNYGVASLEISIF